MQTIEQAITSQKGKRILELLETEKEYKRKYVNALSRLEKIQKLIERPSAIKVAGRYQKLHKQAGILQEEIRMTGSILGAISDRLNTLEHNLAL